jgi:hypothetical protein
MGDEDIRATLQQHWSVSPTEDWHTAVERTHRIYDDNIVVEWPQSGEGILGLGNLKALREAYPAKLTFEIRRIREYTVNFNPAVEIEMGALTEGEPPIDATGAGPSDMQKSQAHAQDTPT